MCTNAHGRYLVLNGKFDSSDLSQRTINRDVTLDLFSFFFCRYGGNRFAV